MEETNPQADQAISEEKTDSSISDFQEQEETSEQKKDKKIKNLLSIIILLAGIVVGSLFVDAVQLVGRSGFSQKMLERVDLFNAKGKTWVAYSEPIVKVQVVTDKECEACQPEEVLIWLKRMIPTVLTEDVQFDTASGENIAQENGIKTLPAFVFSKDLDKTLFYTQAQTLFDFKNDMYVMKTAELGVPAGKYLETPDISENDIQMGNKDSALKIIEFSDFQCPYCKNFHASVIKKILEEYGDKVHLVYKHLPLSFHPQAQNAALAASCANEQGKFIAYSDRLFDTQNDWGKSEGTQKFKTYALQMGLNGKQFNQCLDEKKYQDKIEKDIEEAQNFGISGTPAIFIGDEFKNGVVDYETIKGIIDQKIQE